MSAEQIFEVLPKTDEVDQAAAGFHLDQQIDIARSGGFAARG
jgi:hypothetical protein